MRQLRKRYSVVSTILPAMIAYTASLLRSLVSEGRLSKRQGMAYCREFMAQALPSRQTIRRENRRKADRGHGRNK